MKPAPTPPPAPERLRLWLIMLWLEALSEECPHPTWKAYFRRRP